MNATDTEFYRAFAGRVRTQLAETPRKGAPTVNNTTTTETVEAAAVTATFRAENPHDAHPWCTATDPAADCHGPEIGLSSPEGPGLTLLTGYLSYDGEDSTTSLVYGRAADAWRRITSDQLRAETALVRAHLARLDALADQADAIAEADGQEPAVDPAPHTPVSRVMIETAQLDEGVMVMHRQFSNGTVRVAYDPAQTTYAAAQAVIAVQYGTGALVDIVDGPAEPGGGPIDCTDMASVLTHTTRLASGIVHSARIVADLRLSDPTYRVVPDDADTWFRYLHEAEIANDTAQTTGGAGNPDDTFHQRRILALIQAYAQYWGNGHGRTLKDEYAAQLADAAVFLATEAVTASLAGLDTNPHDISDRLHQAVNRAQDGGQR